MFFQKNEKIGYFCLSKTPKTKLIHKGLILITVNDIKLMDVTNK